MAMQPRGVMMEHKITHASLFTGIGGADLAAEAAGFESRYQCELDPFVNPSSDSDSPARNSTEIFDKSGGEIIKACGGQPTVLSGGFPCQPISTAGKKQGKDDVRWMWPDYSRLIEECRPTWVVIENSYRLTLIPESKILIDDMEGMGYTIRAFRYSASSVGAPHNRERGFIVAHSNSFSKSQTNQSISTIRESGKTWDDVVCCPFDVGRESSNTNLQYIYDPETITIRTSRWMPEGKRIRWGDRRQNTLPDWSQDSPQICRMDDGFSRRVDKSRLHALGNAIVPRQIYPIFEAIARIERR